MSKIDVLCLIIAFIVVTGSVIKILPVDFFGFGGGAQAVSNSSDSVIATVDGVDIYSSDLSVLRYQSQYIDHLDLNDRELLSEIVKDQVLYNEAKRLSLLTTDEDAQSTMEKNYSDLDMRIDGTDRIESEKAAEILDSILQTAEALGMTLEEYKTEIEIPIIKKQMSLSALHDYYLDSLSEPVKAKNDLAEGQYQIYLKNLMAKAVIEYY